MLARYHDHIASTNGRLARVGPPTYPAHRLSRGPARCAVALLNLRSPGPSYPAATGDTPK